MSQNRTSKAKAKCRPCLLYTSYPSSISSLSSPSASRSPASAAKQPSSLSSSPTPSPITGYWTPRGRYWTPRVKAIHRNHKCYHVSNVHWPTFKLGRRYEATGTKPRFRWLYSRGNERMRDRKLRPNEGPRKPTSSSPGWEAHQTLHLHLYPFPALSSGSTALAAGPFTAEHPIPN